MAPAALEDMLSRWLSDFVETSHLSNQADEMQLKLKADASATLRCSSFIELNSSPIMMYRRYESQKLHPTKCHACTELPFKMVTVASV